LPDQRRQKLVQNDPLIVPAELTRRFFENLVVRNAFLTKFIDKSIVSSEHGEMELRDQHVGIVTRVPDNRDGLSISLEVCLVGTKKELRRVITLV
jgi:hypothetical protein